MSYDPTQQVPPQGYPPQQNYPQQQGYPQQSYPQQGYTPQPPAPSTYPQYGTPPPPASGFDFNAFWKKLGLTGQVCLIAGLILFLSLLFTWFDASGSCSGTACAQNGGPDFSKVNRSASGFGIANGSVFVDYQRFSSSALSPSNSGTDSFSARIVWLVILASIALIVLPILIAMGKMAANQGQLFILIAAGVALLIELIYMIMAFGALSQVKGEFDDANKFYPLLKIDATVKYSTGPGFGFWLGLLATLAAGGVYVYFNYIKKPAMVGMPIGAYQQPGQYPPATQYPNTQYPNQYPPSQPYQPPTQYPGQYPGQQPPQYPGQ